MQTDPTGAAQSIDFQGLMLALAHERTCAGIMESVVQGLATSANVALARIWLIKAECEVCKSGGTAPPQGSLHLVASAGESIAEPGLAWDQSDGQFHLMKMGERKVGTVASGGGQPMSLTDISEDSSWIANPAWIRREGIHCFMGQPLVYRDDVLGVLAVFSRGEFSSDGFSWLRMLADHAAVAIANARAFEEIVQLRAQLEIENEYLREEVTEAHSFGEILGDSSALRTVLEQIELVAPTEANVLITGESGTGKELVAREIHKRSSRADGPMIKVNCASVPRELYESEFFGHVKGSFTGALRDRPGRFEAANGGTLFLDEVAEIPVELQSKLLRVLQEGQYERVGEDKTRDTSVRIIAATNRDLKKEVAEGRFRQDLYYRLNVFPVEVLPLRDRAADVPLLARHFLKIAGRELGRSGLRLSEADAHVLRGYQWPGNVRELQNAVERAVIRSRRSGTLQFDLDDSLPVEEKPSQADGTEQLAASTDLTLDDVKRMEREVIVRALEKTNWKIHGPNGAGALLGMKATTLDSRIKKMGIVRK